MSGALFFVILGGIILRVFVGSDLYLHMWDERFHALVSKNLIKNPLVPTLYDNPVLPYDINEWSGSHVWLAKPPLPFWFSALSIKIFGVHEFAVRMPSLIVSAIAIYITFLIGSYLFNKKVGLLAAFFHAINGLLIEVAGGRVSSDISETFFCFFVELAIFFAVFAIHSKRHGWFSLLIGLTTGCALLSKWLPGLVVFPVWIAAAIFSKHFSRRVLAGNLFIACVACAVVYFSWISYIKGRFPEESRFILGQMSFAFKETVHGHEGPVYYYLNVMRIVYGELIYIPLVISLYYLYKRKDFWQWMLLTVWWSLPVLVFSLGATKRQTYLLIAAPAFFIIGAHAFFSILEWRVRKRPILFVKVIVAILLIGLPVRYSIERTKPFQVIDRNPKWAQRIRAAGDSLSLDEKTILFNVEHSIEAMFYHNCIAYDLLPDNRTIQSLQRSGYKIVINTTGKNRVEDQYENVRYISL